MGSKNPRIKEAEIDAELQGDFENCSYNHINNSISEDENSTSNSTETLTFVKRDTKEDSTDDEVIDKHTGVIKTTEYLGLQVCDSLEDLIGKDSITGTSAGISEIKNYSFISYNGEEEHTSHKKIRKI